MIDRLLVANRGEIAVRILATARRLGVRTVAVYAAPDARSQHVADADAAVAIDSYLDQAGILAAASAARATAVHPGYGFLAENADFAQAVVDAGLAWVGPPPAAMRLLGDKASAKALAAQLEVPLLAGYHGPDQSPTGLQAEAERIGFPVLIKASAGGGGRGMRVVEHPADFAAALEAAQREAVAAFGQGRVLLERYVARPRHVEVQILADHHGHAVHLGERECSIQRRHQKLIEESPSPAVDADLRERMGDAAIRLVRAAGYASAGTVEFLLDETGQFAFLEVNARLQVEHPVTEAVTGLDLVELQLRLAAGEPLPLTQQDVRFDGHAIEVRVVAEDALRGFQPSSGQIASFGHPAGVRVDTWVSAGTVVTPYYDSLLAKVIAHGPTRSAAAQELARALRETWIDGVQDNIDLLLACLEHPAFVEGRLHTAFLEEHDIVGGVARVPAPVLAALVAADAFAGPGAADEPWRATGGWRLGRLDQPAAWQRAGLVHEASVSADLGRPAVTVAVGERQLHVHLLGDQPAGLRQRVSVDGEGATVTALREEWRIVEWRGQSFRLRRPRPLSVEDTATTAAGGGSAGTLTAPMPGRVVKIAVGQGTVVAAHQPLVVLEAMKMEHVVAAPHAGVVAELYVEVGAQVASGARLLTLGSPEEVRPVE